MNKIVIYQESAQSPSKEKNLARRAGIFEKHYIPFLKELGIITVWSDCLELWCWQCHKWEKLIHNFPDINYSWIDNSENMLNQAIKRLPDYNLSLWDITNMPEIWDNSQDIMCLFQVIHHLDLENRNKMYNEIFRILKPNWHIIIIESFRPDSNEVKGAIWDVVNRFYAVLSQHPDISLRKRICEAIKSIIFPSNYNPEDYWYFPFNFDNMLWENNELKLIFSVTPKVLYETIPCISDMHVFKKT